MIFSDFTYNGITFYKFVRKSGYMASTVSGDRIQIRSTRDPLPSQDGIQRYIDYYGSRLLEIRGFIKGSSEIDLYEKIQALQNAFDINNLQKGNPTDYGFSPLEWQDAGQDIARYYVKPLNNTLVITESRTGLARQFSVLLEAKDPRKYSATDSLYTINPSTAGGASGFPFKFPVSFGSVANQGTTTIANTGSQSVFPETITLYGPTSGSWTGAKVTNVTSGKYFGFLTTFAIGVGERVVIIPNIGQALWYLSNGSSSDISAQLIAGSNYFQVDSGNSVVSIEGTSLPSTAYATINIKQPF